MVKPLISACSCVFNDEESGHLELMIRSFFDTCGDIPVELCIVDNGSTDGTPELIERYAKKYPIVHERNEKNVGIVALNQAAAMASAPYLLINLSGDTMMMQGSLKALYNKLRRLEAHNNGYATASCMLVEPSGNGLSGKFYVQNLGEDPYDLDYDAIINWKPKESKIDVLYWTIPMLISTKLWNELGGYSTDLVWPGDFSDMDFANKALAKGAIMVLCNDAPGYHFMSVTFKRMAKDAEFVRQRKIAHGKNRTIYESRWGNVNPLYKVEYLDWTPIKEIEEMNDEKVDNRERDLPEDEPKAEKKSKMKRKSTKSKKKTLSTGKAGRPPAAKTESRNVEVEGKQIPIEISVPEKDDLVVTNIEVKTRAQFEHPDTTDEHKDALLSGYFEGKNLSNKHPKMLSDKRFIAKYVLGHITPKKVLVCGCAGGDEMIAYEENKVEFSGQDIVDVLYDEMKRYATIGEIYNVYDGEDTLQILDVLQYMEPDIFAAFMRFLKEETRIKHVVLILNNKGYEFQVCKEAVQEYFDKQVSGIFEKVNVEDDYNLRARDLVNGTNHQVYGLMPEKTLWIYKRK